MNKRQSVVIVGAGKIGSAIGAVLQDRDADISYWDIDSSRVENQKPLSEIVPKADFIFFCVSSSAIREAVKMVLPFLDKNTLVVTLAKGMEENSGQLMSELLEGLLSSDQNFAILGGPMLAEELASGLVGVGAVGAKDKGSFEKLAGLFEGTKLSVEFADSAHDVALAGVLKNIYAIAFGVADGLGWGSNQKGWLAAKSIGEMASIAELLGADRNVFYGTAGLGDLMATGCSSCSRNRKVGEEVIKSGQYMHSEGSRSLPFILKMLGDKSEDFQILSALKKILLEKQNAKKVFATCS